jgi:hypothetical protein
MKNPNQAYQTGKIEFDTKAGYLDHKSSKVVNSGQLSFQAELILIKNRCFGHEKTTPKARKSISGFGNGKKNNCCLNLKNFLEIKDG